MRSIARRTKGATSCCESPSPGSARRPGRDRAHAELSAVPHSATQFLRDHPRRPAPAAGRGGVESARCVSVGLVVRARQQRVRAVLDDRRTLAFHAAVRAGLSRDDCRPRVAHRQHVLVRHADSSGRPPRAAVGRPARGLDGAGVAHRASRRWSLSLARPRHIARGCPGARAMGGHRRRPRRDVVARVVQRRDCRRRTDVRGARYVVRGYAIVLGTVLLALGYGAWRIKTLPLRDVGVIGMVQPNEGFSEKWDPAHADSVVGTLLDGSKHVADEFPRPKLIIWPEAAIPDFLWRRPEWVARITSFVRGNHVPIFTGVMWADSTWRSRLDPFYNAAIFIDTTGNWRPYPVYAKHYLLPVTERVPLVTAEA